MIPEQARHVLALGFNARDVERMHDLAGRNQEGGLSAEELQEFDNYIRVGDLLAILQSKARKFLGESWERKRPECAELRSLTLPARQGATHS